MSENLENINKRSETDSSETFGTQATELLSQNNPLIDTNFSSKEEELGTFLSWSHTLANPFEPDFLTELTQTVKKLENAEVSPARLGEGMGVLVELDYAIMLLTEERARLVEVYQEYEHQKKEISSNYSEEQAREWLQANMPKALERVTNIQKLANSGADSDAEQTQS